MLKPKTIKIEDIYVPAARRKEIDPARIEAEAEKFIEAEEEKPIQVREGKGRYVLVKGVHRLEAHKALGEDTIQALIVHARLH